MIPYLALITALAGVGAAYFFWQARNCIQEGWSSKRIFQFGMKIVYVWVVNLVGTFVLAVLLICVKKQAWGWSELFYMTTPFLIGLCAPRYDDRKWAIPLLILILLLQAASCFYLFICGI
jgi:hypothetical protein